MRLRVQLQIEPFLWAHGLHLPRIVRARPEGEAVQRLKNL